MQFDRRFVFLLLLLLAVSLVAMALLPFADTSEPRYAEIARVMAVSGDWITPWFQPGVPFWGKPPLSFWAQALSIVSLPGCQCSPSCGLCTGWLRPGLMSGQQKEPY